MTNDPSAIAGVDVSRETMEKLLDLSGLISKWTKSINLIAPASVPDIWERHIVDSVQLYKHAGPNWTTWTDLGSGGGLPGLVIAILSKGEKPVTLVESDIRKCLFLNTARRELDLNVTVQNARIEEAKLASADVVSARALASLDDLLGFAHNILNPNGIALFPKGAKFQEDLDQAKENWHFEYETHTSLTNPDARILEISRIGRREP